MSRSVITPDTSDAPSALRAAKCSGVNLYGRRAGTRLPHPPMPKRHGAPVVVLGVNGGVGLDQ
jgi:hypothetical protein